MKKYINGRLWFDTIDLIFFTYLCLKWMYTVDSSTKSVENDGDSNRESKDFSQDTNEDNFNKNNIDFKNLEDNLNNNIYYDKRLTSNTINHIRGSIGSSVEVQWESGKVNKILKKIVGKDSSVGFSKLLISRANKGEKTLQLLHNHTSGIPLPNPQDLINMIEKKIIFSGIIGDYGFLSIKNRFKSKNRLIFEIKLLNYMGIWRERRIKEILGLNTYIKK